MEYLLNTVVTYRVHTVEEAEAMHERFKNDGRFELVQFGYTIKVKGEIVDQYQVVKMKLIFTNEKEPEATYNINFEEI